MYCTSLSRRFVNNDMKISFSADDADADANADDDNGDDDDVVVEKVVVDDG
jgi:hypothetical protein